MRTAMAARTYPCFQSANLLSRPVRRGAFHSPRHRLVLAVALLFLVVPAAFSQNVLTYHNDVARTGQNVNETILTPSNVNQTQFGKLLTFNVDGFIVGQPLYMQNVMLPDGAHNVVYVATLHDTVYAFDADGGNGGAPLWTRSFTDAANGITSVPATEAGCNNVTKFSEHGVIGTGVIDPVAGVLYLVAKTKENGSYFQRLHALDIKTGLDVAVTTIAASVPGTGDGGSTITFNPLNEMTRTGVLLANNKVYLTFSANGCKQVANHGWVLAYNADTSSQNYLQQVAAFSTTPNTNNGGIWQAGSGAAADSDGNLYFETADATFDADTGGSDYGDSILKLDPNLNLLSYFTPSSQNALNSADLDLASVGPIVLPDQTGTPHPALVIGSGKDETIYLMDRNNLGGYNILGDQIVQEVAPFSSKQRFGVATYWNGRIYFQQLGQVTIAYSLTNGVLSSSPVDQATTSWARSNPGSISANGNTNGILWQVTSTSNSATLRAYDAMNLATELYDSDQASGSRDTLTVTPHYSTPTVVNGRVYVGTQSQLIVYGLLTAAPVVSLTPSSLTFGSQSVNTTSSPQTVTLTNTGNYPLSVTSVQASGDFAQTNTCTTNVAIGASCTISVTFTPTATGTRNGQLTIRDSATNSPQTLSLSGTGTAVLAATSVSVTSSLNPATYGQSVTFTATVSASGGTPTGTVTFFDGAANLGTRTLDGSGKATLTPTILGTVSHSITATYSGDSSFSASSSAPLTQIVNQATSSTALVSSVNPSVFDQPVTFTATVTPQFGGTATGNLTFNDGAVALGTVAVSGNVAALSVSSLSKGNHSITATYAGDTNVAASTSSAVSQVVNQASSTTAVTSSINPSVANQTIQLTATVTGQFGGTPTGSVTFFSGATSLGKVNLSGGTATLNQTFATSGTRSITASYSGAANFSASTSPVLSQVVNLAPSSTSVSSNLNPSNFGDSVTFTATVSSAFGTPNSGNVVFKMGNTTLGTVPMTGGVATFTTSTIGAGTRIITATYKGNATFATSISPNFSQVVNRIASQTALTSSANPSVAGQSVTFTATVTAAVGTPTGTVNFKDNGVVIGSGTLNNGVATFTTSTLTSGSHNMAATFVQSGNYNGSTGTLVQQVN